MKLQTTINTQSVSYDLDALVGGETGNITIGRKTKKVWNAISIDDDSIDEFQCHLIGTAGGTWKLYHGQERTECPKGLLSDRLIPCNTCTGRCVNVRPGRPKYIRHSPEVPTLLNARPLCPYGDTVNTGDTITIGNITLEVR